MSLVSRLKTITHDAGKAIRCLGAPRKYFKIKDIPSTYNQDCLITLAQNTDAMQEPRFQAAWEYASRLFPNGAQPLWRTYLCCWAAEHALHLEGDFVECGVNLGGLSRAIAEYVNFNNTDKTFYLFDTYCGLAKTHISPGEEGMLQHHNEIYYDCYAEAKQTFKDFPRVTLVKGTVPESLATVAIDKVAYLSIDMNCVMPEVEALRFFWDKLVPGALVVFDDYGWVPHRIQKEGIDAVAREKGVSVLTLPTGQGLLVKP
jgi:Macrocin-O-methyltransferase (TylF).